ncbi:MAG TPA: hypothetical protein VIU12_17245 [Chryseolinea sp.]
MTYVKGYFGLFFLIAFLFILGCSTPPQTEKNYIPSLDDISGKWVKADTVAMEPSLRNFRGQAVANRDLTSISWFASAPYSGGYHTGVFKIDGQVPLVDMFRWQPYQTLRKASYKKFALLSTTRMLPEEDGVLWRIEITNQNDQPDTANISIDAIGFISQYGGDWQWWYPFPKMDGMVTKRDEEVEMVRKSIGSATMAETQVDELVEGKPTGRKMTLRAPNDRQVLDAPKYNTSPAGKNTLLVHDTETPAITGFTFKTTPDTLLTFHSGGTAQWKLPLKPGETKVIEYLMHYGNSDNAVSQHLNTWSTAFDEKFTQVKSVWEQRWQSMFQPKNSLFSGCFPVLETEDTLASRVYYTGPLTMLYLLNTNLPQHKKVILTGGPKWGATISFFWDNTEWSTVQAVTDPAQLKENILSWMKVDPSRFYGVDNFGGKGVGNPYSANYWALFQLVRSYLAVTGDYAFLKEKVEGKTILETLEHYATNGQRMALFGKPGFTDPMYKLADFGSDEWNLLECVPTYKQIVPSFNAGYIWMLRETADLYATAGDQAKADQLRNQATEMKGYLMKLYAGNGVWNCLYPDNKTIEVRHCLDFMFMGRFMAKDLSDTMKTEMIKFVDQELMTDHWMRAQSLLDVAAKNSDRPDHGPLGAYDGWPAGTMDAFVQMGYPEKALRFYRSLEPVTYEGSWAQSHELWGDDKEKPTAKVRIAERGWHARDAMAGIGMSQVMLKCFFGFNPDLQGRMIKEPGTTHFNGTLRHVLFHSDYYTLTSVGGKISAEKEK